MGIVKEVLYPINVVMMEMRYKENIHSSLNIRQIFINDAQEWMRCIFLAVIIDTFSFAVPAASTIIYNIECITLVTIKTFCVKSSLSDIVNYSSYTIRINMLYNFGSNA